MSLLPQQKTPPQTDPTRLTMLLYARSKFGKSTFAATIPGAVFLATEPGLSHLSTFQVPIPDWDTFLSACAELAKGDHNFKCIVLDTVDLVFKLCAQHICAKYKVDFEGDLSFGKGWAMVSSEFQRVMLKLAQLPYGLVLISHTQEKEHETRTGKVVRIAPTLPDKAAKFVLGLVDIIGYGDFQQETDAEGNKTFRRIIRTKPTLYYEAGDRTGRLPDVIDLDYPSFIAAYRQAISPNRDQASPAKAAQATSPKPAAAKDNQNKPPENKT